MAWDGTGTPIAPVTSGPTTADLISRTRDLLAEQGADQFDDTTDIVPALNDGKSIMFSEVDALPFLIDTTLAPGERDIAPPQRLSRIVSVQANGRELDMVLASEIPDRRFDATGTPTHYCIEFLGATGDPIIRVFPAASATCAITGMGYAQPVELSNSTPTVTPAWHKEFAFVPCYHAASVLLISDNRIESAGLMSSRFASEVSRYKSWIAKRVSSRTATVNPIALGPAYRVNR
jgi:hypothetical protein